MRTRRSRTLGAVLSAVLATGCSPSQKALVVNGEVDLLQRPYPLNYPSSAPMPNRVIETLKSERVQVLATTVDKDFMVYEVRTSDGQIGYVIAAPEVRVVDAK